MAHLLPEADPVQKVTIVSRGQMGGYTRMTPEEDRKMWSMPQFKAAMASALGGHVAEELGVRAGDTGASNDLRKAYSIARAMVCDYGMSPVLGALAVGSEDDGRFYRGYGEHLAEKIDLEHASAGGRGPQPGRGPAGAAAGRRSRRRPRSCWRSRRIDGKAMARLFGPRPTTAPQLPPVRLVPEQPAALARAGRRRPRAVRRLARGKPALAALPFTLSVRWRRRRKPTPPTLAEA